MDKYDFRARGVADNSGNIHSLGKEYNLGKLKNLSDCCGSEKQGHESDNEISSCEGKKSVATESKCLNCENLSSSECTKDNARDCGSLSSVISTSTSLTQNKEICGGGSCAVISCCNGVPGDGNTKDGEELKHSSVSRDVSSEARQPCTENSELVTRTDVRCPNVGEDGQQLKTESSSSNSSRIILPASSNDSCQEASVDGKGCKFSKTSDMVTSTSAEKKCSPNECLVKSSVPGGASVIVQSSGATDSDKALGVIADGNSITVEKTDFLTSNLCKMKITELPDQSNANSCHRVDDALEVACRVAKEVEQDVGKYKEASESSSTVEEKNSETVHQSSVDSDPTRKDLATESCRVKLCEVQVECATYCPSKDVGDRKILRKDKQLCGEVDESSEKTGTKVTRESSYLTKKPEDISCNGQTTDVSSIDLNEDFLGNEMNHTQYVSKPIPVVAKSGVSVCSPLCQTEGKPKPGGWRGSAATSAFRQTSFFKKCNGSKGFFRKDDKDSSKPLRVKGIIDLNIAAAGADLDSEFLPGKRAEPPSSLPCGESSSMDVCSTRVGRLDFDLNCASENNDNIGHLSSPTASSSKPCARDFDLNDNLVSRDPPWNDAHQSGQGKLPLRNKASDDPALLFLGNSRQLDPTRACPGYLPNLSSLQHYTVANPGMLPPAEQMQRVVSQHHNGTYTPPPLPSNAFHYNHGLLFHPNSHLSSSPVYSPGVLPYMTDPRGVNFMPQMTGASHLMEAPGRQGPGDMATTIRPNFDLNNVNSMENRSSNSSSSSRGVISRYQQYIPPSMEEQMRSFQQSAASFKRREPEGGWDSHQLAYRQVNPWR